MSLILSGLAVTVYTVAEQIRSGIYVHKPLGFAIGCGLILWGFWERGKSTRPPEQHRE